VAGKRALAIKTSSMFPLRGIKEGAEHARGAGLGGSGSAGEGLQVTRHIPCDEVCLGVDVQSRQPLHDLQHIHRLRHPRVEEAHISIDATREATVMPVGLDTGPGVFHPEPLGRDLAQRDC
jgi:hypothetical protein